MTSETTHVRLSIGSQIERAAERLGMAYTITTSPTGTLGYLIDEVPMTPGDAADYLIDGGFAGAYGAAKVRVHPDRLAAQKAARETREAGNTELAGRILDDDMPTPSW
jgi:hypothetical protein